MDATVPAGLRVLQVGPLYVNHVRRWAEHAAELGCIVHAAGHVAPGRRPADLADVGVDTEPESHYRLGPARRVVWLREVVRRFRPDLIHAHWLSTWGYVATLCGHRPVVVTPWGSDVYLAEGVQRSRADRAVAGADGVIARSRHMRGALLARGVPSEQIYLIDLGVDLDRFRPPSPGEQASLRRQLGLPDGPLVLSVRAGTPLYNLDVVLEGFRILRARLPAATLVVAHGNAPLSPRVRGMLREEAQTGAVHVVGPVAPEEMPKYFRAASIGISIPSSDGSPNSVWEALASGLAMIVSRLPQVDERVGGSGAVRQIDPRPEAVACALHDLLVHPGPRLGMARAARAWALSSADRREQTVRLGALYAGLASDARRGSPDLAVASARS